MKVNKNEACLIAGIVGFACTCFYAAYCTVKVKQVSKHLADSIDDMVAGTEIDIPDNMVEEAIERAVDREVRTQVSGACAKAVKDVEGSLKAEIKDVVEEEFDKQKGEVAKELKRKIGSLDISQIRKEVVREAKETASEKFKSDLDDILDKHNDELENISRIYSSIADKLSGD